MELIKVDIQTGRVLEDNLEEYRAREAMHESLKDPAWYPNPAMGPRPEKVPEKVDPDLMERVRKFNRRTAKRKNSWSNAELYRLAVLMGRKKMHHTQAGFRLSRSPEACRYMFRKMKGAGVI